MTTTPQTLSKDERRYAALQKEITERRSEMSPKKSYTALVYHTATGRLTAGAIIDREGADGFLITGKRFDKQSTSDEIGITREGAVALIGMLTQLLSQPSK